MDQTTTKRPNAAYQRLLRDPRWQRRRLEVLNEANWRCQDAACGRHDRTLEVHHCYYLYGVKPWDYPRNAFLALCEDCHQRRQKTEASLKIELLKCLRLVPIQRLEQMTWWLLGQALKEADAE